MNFWQALFAKRKNLSPKKRHSKPQGLGWQGWALLGGALAIGAALAILISSLTHKGRAGRPGEPQPPQQPRDEQPQGD